MKQEDAQNAYVCDLIALCYVLNEFEEFKNKLINLISSKCNRNLIYTLNQVSKGEYCFNAKKERLFYKENKSVIDTINRYSNINTFIYAIVNDDNLEFFYQYILNNKSKLGKIISLLKKIKELGFEKLEFNESLDFSNNEYVIDTNFAMNSNITYLDNIEVLPNYATNVKYRTAGSNYSIMIHPSIILYPSTRDFKEYGNQIIVNSLLFDESRLPESITKESIFDEIIELKNQQQDKCNKLRNSVNLSISIEELYNQFNSTSKIVESLSNVESNRELIEILSNIKASIEKLKNISIEYNSSISKENPDITSETLQTEKELYLARRLWASIDID